MFEDLTTESNEGKEYTRNQKAMLFVIKTLNELCDEGVLTGKVFDIVNEALEAIEGFKPTDKEIIECIAVLKEEGYIGD